MVISEICHVNVVVSDMDRSIEFYRDLLGLEIILDKEIGSEEFSRGVGLKDVKARVVMLKLKTENTLFELFQYMNPEGDNIGHNAPNTVPISHIAFKVTDIEKHYSDLKNKGVKFVSEPQTILDGVKFCYLRDPDGALLELIQFPE